MASTHQERAVTTGPPRPAPPAERVVAAPSRRVVDALCVLAGVTGALTLAVTVVLTDQRWDHPGRAVLFGLAIAGLQIVPLRVSHEGQGENLGLEEAFLVAMALYLTPPETLVVLGSAVAIGQTWQRSGWMKGAFNTGGMVTSAGAGLAVSRGLGAHVGDLSDQALLGAAAGALTYAAVSMLLVAGVISTVQRTSYLDVVRDGIEVRMATWTTSLAVGVLLAAALEGRLWLLVVIAVPVVMFQLAFIRAFASFNERRDLERLYDAAGSIRSSMESEQIVTQVLVSAQRLLDATEARLVATTDALPSGALRAEVDDEVAVEVPARRAGGPWGENDGSLLRALASVASGALTNAALFERLRAITSSLGEGVVSLDPDGIVTFANPAAEHMLGLAEGSLQGLRLHEVVHAHPGAHGDSAADCRLATALGSGGASRDDDDTFLRVGGERVPVAVSTSPVLVQGRPTGTVMAFRDITERQALQEQLEHQVLHDDLTGLSNRVLFTDRLEQADLRASRSLSAYAVLFIDLDRFKVVNDSLGHHAGDELLMSVAQRLRAKVRPGDTLARFGGDEFVMLLIDLDDEVHAEQVAHRLLDDLRTPFRILGREVPVSASIGVVVVRPGQSTPEQCLRDADVAMYRAKAKGKARYEVFRPGTGSEETERLDREIALREAIERGELEVHYQPVFSVDSGSIVSLEALVRWRHPDRGLVPPGEFIPLAEDTGLIIPLGRFVLEESCRQLQEWIEADPGRANLVVAVNLSTHQFRQPDLSDQVADVLAVTGLDAARLCLEVTESAMMADADAATEMLKRLKALGARLSIDDFGTGYSSLSYLKRFPVDFVKIDRSFIGELAEGDVDTEIVRAVIRLSAAIGMRAVAEGVETEEQLQALRALGCPLVQGFHLARPQPPADIERLLHQPGTDLVP